MFFNIYNKLGFIGELKSFELWILLLLCLAFVLFSALTVILLILRKRGNTQGHITLLVICLMLLLFFIMSGFIIASGRLSNTDIAFFANISKAYDNFLLNILHVAVLVPLICCCYILLYPPRKTKTAINKKSNQDLVYFSQFDPEIEDGDVEIVEIRDVFKEFGSDESDVRKSVDRIANKLTQIKREDKSKSLITAFDKALSKSEKGAAKREKKPKQ